MADVKWWFEKFSVKDKGHTSESIQITADFTRLITKPLGLTPTPYKDTNESFQNKTTKQLIEQGQKLAKEKVNLFTVIEVIKKRDTRINRRRNGRDYE